MFIFINRDYSRTEHDDWLLNVQPQLRENKGSVEVYYEGKLVGWKIQFIGE